MPSVYDGKIVLNAKEAKERFLAQRAAKAEAAERELTEDDLVAVIERARGIAFETSWRFRKRVDQEEVASAAALMVWELYKKRAWRRGSALNE